MASFEQQLWAANFQTRKYAARTLRRRLHNKRAGDSTPSVFFGGPHRVLKQPTFTPQTLFFEEWIPLRTPRTLNTGSERMRRVYIVDSVTCQGDYKMVDGIFADLHVPEHPHFPKVRKYRTKRQPKRPNFRVKQPKVEILQIEDTPTPQSKPDLKLVIVKDNNCSTIVRELVNASTTAFPAHNTTRGETITFEAPSNKQAEGLFQYDDIESNKMTMNGVYKPTENDCLVLATTMLAKHLGDVVLTDTNHPTTFTAGEYKFTWVRLPRDTIPSGPVIYVNLGHCELAYVTRGQTIFFNEPIDKNGLIYKPMLVTSAETSLKTFVPWVGSSTKPKLLQLKKEDTPTPNAWNKPLQVAVASRVARTVRFPLYSYMGDTKYFPPMDRVKQQMSLITRSENDCLMFALRSYFYNGTVVMKTPNHMGPFKVKTYRILPHAGRARREYIEVEYIIRPFFRQCLELTVPPYALRLHEQHVQLVRKIADRYIDVQTGEEFYCTSGKYFVMCPLSVNEHKLQSHPTTHQTFVSPWVGAPKRRLKLVNFTSSTSGTEIRPTTTMQATRPTVQYNNCRFVKLVREPLKQRVELNSFEPLKDNNCLKRIYAKLGITEYAHTNHLTTFTISGQKYSWYKVDPKHIHSTERNFFVQVLNGHATLCKKTDAETFNIFTIVLPPGFTNMLQAVEDGTIINPLAGYGADYYVMNYYGAHLSPQAATAQWVGTSEPPTHSAHMLVTSLAQGTINNITYANTQEWIKGDFEVQRIKNKETRKFKTLYVESYQIPIYNQQGNITQTLTSTMTGVVKSKTFEIDIKTTVDGKKYKPKKPTSVKNQELTEQVNESLTASVYAFSAKAMLYADVTQCQTIKVKYTAGCLTFCPIEFLQASDLLKHLQDESEETPLILLKGFVPALNALYITKDLRFVPTTLTLTCEKTSSTVNTSLCIAVNPVKPEEVLYSVHQSPALTFPPHGYMYYSFMKLNKHATEFNLSEEDMDSLAEYVSPIFNQDNHSEGFEIVTPYKILHTSDFAEYENFSVSSFVSDLPSEVSEDESESDQSETEEQAQQFIPDIVKTPTTPTQVQTTTTPLATTPLTLSQSDSDVSIHFSNASQSDDDEDGEKSYNQTLAEIEADEEEFERNLQEFMVTDSYKNRDTLLRLVHSPTLNLYSQDTPTEQQSDHITPPPSPSTTPLDWETLEECGEVEIYDPDTMENISANQTAGVSTTVFKVGATEKTVNVVDVTVETPDSKQTTTYTETVIKHQNLVAHKHLDLAITAMKELPTGDNEVTLSLHTTYANKYVISLVAQAMGVSLEDNTSSSLKIQCQLSNTAVVFTVDGNFPYFHVATTTTGHENYTMGYTYNSATYYISALAGLNIIQSPVNTPKPHALPEPPISEILQATTPTVLDATLEEIDFSDDEVTTDLTQLTIITPAQFSLGSIEDIDFSQHEEPIQQSDPSKIETPTPETKLAVVSWSEEFDQADKERPITPVAPNTTLCTIENLKVTTKDCMTSTEFQTTLTKSKHGYGLCLYSSNMTLTVGKIEAYGPTSLQVGDHITSIKGVNSLDAKVMLAAFQSPAVAITFDVLRMDFVLKPQMTKVESNIKVTTPVVVFDLTNYVREKSELIESVFQNMQPKTTPPGPDTITIYIHGYNQEISAVTNMILKNPKIYHPNQKNILHALNEDDKLNVASLVKKIDDKEFSTDLVYATHERQIVKEITHASALTAFTAAYKTHIIKNISSGSTVLDIGYGKGNDNTRYAAANIKVTGIDTSQRMLDIAQATKPPNVTTIKEGLLTHTKKNVNYNHMVAFNSLHYPLATTSAERIVSCFPPTATIDIIIPSHHDLDGVKTSTFSATKDSGDMVVTVGGNKFTEMAYNLPIFITALESKFDVLHGDLTTITTKPSTKALTNKIWTDIQNFAKNNEDMQKILMGYKTFHATPKKVDIVNNWLDANMAPPINPFKHLSNAAYACFNIAAIKPSPEVFIINAANKELKNGSGVTCAIFNKHDASLLLSNEIEKLPTYGGSDKLKDHKHVVLTTVKNNTEPHPINILHVAAPKKQTLRRNLQPSEVAEYEDRMQTELIETYTALVDYSQNFPTATFYIPLLGAGAYGHTPLDSLTAFITAVKTSTTSTKFVLLLSDRAVAPTESPSFSTDFIYKLVTHMNPNSQQVTYVTQKPNSCSLEAVHALAQSHDGINLPLSAIYCLYTMPYSLRSLRETMYPNVVWAPNDMVDLSIYQQWLYLVGIDSPCKKSCGFETPDYRDGMYYCNGCGVSTTWHLPQQLFPFYPFTSKRAARDYTKSINTVLKPTTAAVHKVIGSAHFQIKSGPLTDSYPVIFNTDPEICSNYSTWLELKEQEKQDFLDRKEEEELTGTSTPQQSTQQQVTPQQTTQQQATSNTSTASITSSTSVSVAPSLSVYSSVDLHSSQSDLANISTASDLTPTNSSSQSTHTNTSIYGDMENLMYTNTAGVVIDVSVKQEQPFVLHMYVNDEIDFEPPGHRVQDNTTGCDTVFTIMEPQTVTTQFVTVPQLTILSVHVSTEEMKTLFRTKGLAFQAISSKCCVALHIFHSTPTAAYNSSQQINNLKQNLEELQKFTEHANLYTTTHSYNCCVSSNEVRYQKPTTTISATPLPDLLTQVESVTPGLNRYSTANVGNYTIYYTEDPSVDMDSEIVSCNGMVICIDHQNEERFHVNLKPRIQNNEGSTLVYKYGKHKLTTSNPDASYLVVETQTSYYHRIKSYSENVMWQFFMYFLNILYNMRICVTPTTMYPHYNREPITNASTHLIYSSWNFDFKLSIHNTNWESKPKETLNPIKLIRNLITIPVAVKFHGRLRPTQTTHTNLGLTSTPTEMDTSVLTTHAAVQYLPFYALFQFKLVPTMLYTLLFYILSGYGLFTLFFYIIILKFRSYITQAFDFITSKITASKVTESLEVMKLKSTAIYKESGSKVFTMFSYQGTPIMIPYSTLFTAITLTGYLTVIWNLALYLGQYSPYENYSTAPYHVTFQKVLVAFGLTESVQYYFPYASLSEACSASSALFCSLGSPHNFHYPNDYTQVKVQATDYLNTAWILVVFFGPSFVFIFLPWLCLCTFTNYITIQMLIIPSIAMNLGALFIFVRGYFVKKCCGEHTCLKHVELGRPLMISPSSSSKYTLQFTNEKICPIHNWYCQNADSHTHTLGYELATSIETAYKLKPGTIKPDCPYTEVPEDATIPIMKVTSTSTEYVTDYPETTMQKLHLQCISHLIGSPISVSQSKSKPKQQHKGTTLTNRQITGQIHAKLLTDLKRQVPHRDLHSYLVNFVPTTSKSDNILPYSVLEQDLTLHQTTFLTKNFVFSTNQSADPTTSSFIPSQINGPTNLPSKYFFIPVIDSGMLCKLDKNIVDEVLQTYIEVTTIKTQSYAYFKTSFWFTIFLTLTSLLVAAIAFSSVTYPANTAYAGLNPTMQGNIHAQPFVHNSELPDSSLILVNGANKIVWRANNGSLYFTNAISPSQCASGSVPYIGVRGEHTELCSSARLHYPSTLFLGSLRVMVLYDGVSYTTPTMSLTSKSKQICAQMGSGSVRCASILPTGASSSAFSLLLSSVLLITTILFYLQLTQIFRFYTNSVLLSVGIQILTVLATTISTPLAVTIQLFTLTYGYTNWILVTLSLLNLGVLLSTPVGLTLVICFSAYKMYRLFSTSGHGCVYNDGGTLRFSGSFEQIAASTFPLTNATTAQLMVDLGLTYAQLNVYTSSRDRSVRKLANALLARTLDSTSEATLYDGTTGNYITKQVLRRLKSAVTVVVTPVTNNLCKITSSTDNGLGLECTGTFISDTEIVTCAHGIGSINILATHKGTTYTCKVKSVRGDVCILLTTTQNSTVHPVKFSTDFGNGEDDNKTFVQFISFADSSNSESVTINNTCLLPSGHFFRIGTEAGESGSPYVYNNNIIGIHYGIDHHEQFMLASKPDGTFYVPSTERNVSAPIIFSAATFFKPTPTTKKVEELKNLIALTNNKDYDMDTDNAEILQSMFNHIEAGKPTPTDITNYMPETQVTQQTSVTVGKTLIEPVNNLQTFMYIGMILIELFSYLMLPAGDLSVLFSLIIFALLLKFASKIFFYSQEMIRNITAAFFVYRYISFFIYLVANQAFLLQTLTLTRLNIRILTLMVTALMMTPVVLLTVRRMIYYSKNYITSCLLMLTVIAAHTYTAYTFQVDQYTSIHHYLTTDLNMLYVGINLLTGFFLISIIPNPLFTTMVYIYILLDCEALCFISVAFLASYLCPKPLRSLTTLLCTDTVTLTVPAYIKWYHALGTDKEYSVFYAVVESLFSTESTHQVPVTISEGISKEVKYIFGVPSSAKIEDKEEAIIEYNENSEPQDKLVAHNLDKAATVSGLFTSTVTFEGTFTESLYPQVQGRTWLIREHIDKHYQHIHSTDTIVITTLNSHHLAKESFPTIAGKVRQVHDLMKQITTQSDEDSLCQAYILALVKSTVINSNRTKEEMNYVSAQTMLTPALIHIFAQAYHDLVTDKKFTSHITTQSDIMSLQNSLEMYQEMDISTFTPPEIKAHRKRMNTIKSEIARVESATRKLEKFLDNMHKNEISKRGREDVLLKVNNMLRMHLNKVSNAAHCTIQTPSAGLITLASAFDVRSLCITQHSNEVLVIYDSVTDSYTVETAGVIYTVYKPTNITGTHLTHIEGDVIKFPMYPVVFSLQKEEQVDDTDVTQQANVGYSQKAINLEVQQTPAGTVITLDGIVVVTETTDLKSAFSIRGKFFKFVNGSKALTAKQNTPQILRLLKQTVSQQAVIRIGGSRLSKEHTAISITPVQTPGHCTYAGISVCRKCKSKEQHTCLYADKFVQIPSTHTSNIYKLTDNPPCLHNKFLCSLCNPPNPLEKQSSPSVFLNFLGGF
ncbi:replicase polyprotein 1a [Fathead minnow nidovirus]|uniref:Replicase polyprotein 1a n=1 Tax=Fathead minnow nidovirus TaxID=889873 RepID=H8PHI3_9NIDO|nr:replicase polyprotein 1a [Fathead minnow nidovirus]AFD32425.1 replicase polyprotein 1a [Fathead minnow nidovirus]